MNNDVNEEIEKAWAVKKLMDSMTPIQKLYLEKLETIETMLVDLKKRVERLEDGRFQV